MNKSIQKKIGKEFFPPLLGFLVIIILWQLVSTYYFSSLILPSPYEMVRELLLKPEILWEHTLTTFLEVVYGFLLAMVVGFLCAIGIIYSNFLGNLIYPLVLGSQTVPIMTLAPIFILWFGYGAISKVFLVMMVMFFPITLNAIFGLTITDPETLDMMATLKASKFQVFCKIRFPNSLPYIFMGLKISIAFGLVAAVISEWMGAYGGLGYYMMKENKLLNIKAVFATILLMVVGSLTMFALVFLLEWFAVPWYRKKNKKNGGGPTV